MHDLISWVWVGTGSDVVYIAFRPKTVRLSDYRVNKILIKKLLVSLSVNPSGYLPECGSSLRLGCKIKKTSPWLMVPNFKVLVRIRISRISRNSQK